jgi:hypothetical protein
MRPAMLVFVLFDCVFVFTQWKVFLVRPESHGHQKVGRENRLTEKESSSLRTSVVALVLKIRAP